jgi:hypothetical protein
MREIADPVHPSKDSKLTAKSHTAFEVRDGNAGAG